jgi:flagellar assembly factor FliW
LITTFKSTRFNQFSIDEEKVITFVQPLVGFPGSRRYALLIRAESDLIGWLHSVDEPNVALPVIDPWTFFPDYELEVDDASEKALSPESLTDLLTLAAVRVSEDQSETKASLRFPIIINTAKKIAVQAYNLIPVAIGDALFPPDVAKDPAFKDQSDLVTP